MKHVGWHIKNFLRAYKCLWSKHFNDVVGCTCDHNGKYDGKIQLMKCRKCGHQSQRNFNKPSWQMVYWWVWIGFQHGLFPAERPFIIYEYWGLGLWELRKFYPIPNEGQTYGDESDNMHGCDTGDGIPTFPIH